MFWNRNIYTHARMHAQASPPAPGPLASSSPPPPSLSSPSSSSITTTTTTTIIIIPHRRRHRRRHHYHRHLHPCAGAPSGRGHTIFWTVLTWPQDITPASMSTLQDRHEAPPRHGAKCRGPSFGGLSGRWVLSVPCQYFPCPILPTILLSDCFYCAP